MQSQPDVVFSLSGDVRRNTRALKQLRALAALGCTAEVLTFGPAAGPDGLEEGIRLRTLAQPEGGGPRFFARAHRLFKREALHIPARVYHASDLYTLPAMHAAARRHGGRLVYDARELYPDVSATAGRPWARLFWRRLEAHYLPHADAVFTVSEGIAARLAQRYGIPSPTVLYNVPPLQQVPPSNLLRERMDLPRDAVILLHQGQLRSGRGCTLLVDAMRSIRGAVLIFLGSGPLRPALVQQVRALGLEDRIRFLDPVPPGDLLPVTASADVGITLLEDTCLNHRYALPNKLFEYLMAGLPVLASDLPEMRRVVASFKVGCLVNPADQAALVRVLQYMVDDAPARARWAANTPAVFETFSWEEASHCFRRTYQRLLSRRT